MKIQKWIVNLEKTLKKQSKGQCIGKILESLIKKLSVRV